MTDTTPRVMALESCTLLLRPDDHVAETTRDLQAGTVLRRPDGSELVVTQGVPRGHKLAVRGVETGGSEELDLGQDEFIPWQLGAVT